jgi:hypothetical protein
MKIHLLETKRDGLRADVIAALEEILTQAREGTVLAVAIATVETDHALGFQCVVGDQWARLVAAVASMQHDLIAAQSGDG